MESTEEIIERLTASNRLLSQQVEDLQRDSTSQLNRIRELLKDSAVLRHTVDALQVSRYNSRRIQGMVAEFHNKFGVPMGDKPMVPSDKEMRLRLKLIAEEFFELLEASVDTAYTQLVDAAKGDVYAAIDSVPLDVDMVEAVDALGDLAYVVEGCNLVMGVDSQAILLEIHENNMTKDGKHEPGGIHKITKGPNWQPPDIAGCLRKQGWKGE